MISASDKKLLLEVAGNLGVDPADLFRLIQFESRFNPFAKNPVSSARGLIQFTDLTARSLGYTSSVDLVSSNPTVAEQLKLVERYLMRFRPFSGKQSLYMSVFYPAARNWSPSKRFPDAVRRANPGINNPGDYIDYVEGRKGNLIGRIALMTAAFLLFTSFYWKGRVS